MGQDTWLWNKVFSKSSLNNGFFVEFGALDGKEQSISFYFEHTHGWRGLLARFRILPFFVFHISTEHFS